MERHKERAGRARATVKEQKKRPRFRIVNQGLERGW
jgi:hypothetical protein